MKIIDNRNNDIFGELNPGVMFMLEGVEGIFMKTEATSICNCINIANGHLLNISGGDFVTVVDATLILE